MPSIVKKAPTPTDGIVKLPTPAPGQTITVKVSPNQMIEVPFSMDDVTVTPIGNDLHIAFAGEAGLILKDFGTVIEQGASPLLIFADGSVVAGDILLTALNTEIIQTAAASAGSSGGAGEYYDDMGNLINGLDKLDVQNPDQLNAPLQPQEEPQQDPLLPVENSPPLAADDEVSTNEDRELTFSVLGNDSDPDGDTLSVTSFTNPGHGTLTLNPDGTFTYTPDANYHGPDSFTYTISDGKGGTDTATVNLTVTPVNDAPDAVNDSATTNEDTPVTIPVLSNDTDVDGDALSVSSVTQPTHGTVVINNDGTVTYTPAANYHGPDSFTYTISDGKGGTDTATVNLTVNPVNDAPDAVNDSATTAEDTPVTITVLSNDSDPDGDALSVSSVTQPLHGTVAINPNGTVTYTPAANYNGPDSFTYTISDGHGGTDTATVNLTVTPVNDAPVFVNPANPAQTVTSYSFTYPENSADADVLGTVKATDVDAGASITYSITGGDPNGYYEINSNGQISLTAAGVLAATNNFEVLANTRDITVTANDGQGGTTNIQVTLTETNVNEAPVFVNPLNPAQTVTSYSFTYPEKSADADVLGTVKATDVDAGANITYSITAGDPNGYYEINSNGQISLTAAGVLAATNDFEALANTRDITVTANDGQGGTTDIQVTLTETNVNEAPVFVNPANPTQTVTSYSFTYPENSADADVLGTVKATDVDAGASITYSITGGDPDGYYEINATTGAISLTAAGVLAATNDFEALANTRDITVTANDGQGATTDIQVTLTETNVNETPSITTDTNQDGTADTLPETVYEAGITGPPAGSAAGNGSEIVTGFFTISDPDGLGDIATLTLNGTDFAVGGGGLAGLIGSKAATTYGEVELTAYENGKFTYQYTLLKPFDTTPDANNGNNKVVSGDSFTVGITDKADISDSATITIDIVDDAPSASVKGGTTADTLVLDESAVPAAGDGIHTVTASFADNFSTVSYGADGAGSVSYALSLSSGSVGSGLYALDPTDTNPTGGLGKGAQIMLSMSDGDIVGKVGSTTYFTISVNNDSSSADFGKVTFTQQANIWHNGTGSDSAAALATANGGDIKITQTVTDADGDQASASINLGQNVFSIQDDGPAPVNDSASAIEGEPRPNNIMIVLDVSKSMDDTVTYDGQSMSRLAASKLAIANLLETYEGSSDVRVNLVTFSTDASDVSKGWVTVGEAVSLLNDISSDMYTNYDAGLSTAMSAFTNAGKLAGAQNLLYFFSDGVPNYALGTESTLSGSTHGNTSGTDPDAGIQSGEETLWKTFLNSNDIIAQAIGIGSGVTQTPLNPVAWNGVTESDLNGIAVTTESQLNTVLQGTIKFDVTPVTGNILTNDAAGTDGWTTQKLVSASYGADSHTFTSLTDSHTYDLGNVGTVVLKGDGSYTFTPGTGVDVNDPLTKVLNYTVQDADGSTASATLSLSITDSSEIYAYDNYNQTAPNDSVQNNTQVVLADFSSTSNPASSGSGYNPWIFDSTNNDPTSDDERTTVDGNTNVLNFLTTTNKWIVSSLSYSTLDASVSNGALVIEDNNDTSPGAAQVLTPQFTVGATGSTTLSFSWSRANTDSDDTVTWTLYKLVGSTWTAQTGAGNTGTFPDSNTSGTITTGELTAGASYRIYFSVNDGSGSEDSRLTIDNIHLDVITSGNNATGNVLTDPNNYAGSSDPWAAVDDGGSEGIASLSVWNGTSFVAATSGGTTVTGTYGSLVMYTDGAYIYTPNNASISNGQTETFTYKLAQADGDSDTASLVIKISSTAIDGTAAANTLSGTAGDDVIRGFGDDDVLSGLGGNDRIEGGAGDDHLSGGAGNDLMYGGDGNDLLYGGEGNDILYGGEGLFVAGQGQVTKVTFASGYDAGDVVSLTVDGKTYSHTVVAGALTAENVYDALKAVSVDGVTLAASLTAKGVAWASSLTSNAVTLTGNSGTANAFTVTAAVDNSNDVGLPWKYTVDFDNDLSNFNNSTTEYIRLVIGGETYQQNWSSGGSDSDTRFDATANALVTQINDDLGSGTAAYNSSGHTFTLTLNQSTAVSGTSTSSDGTASVSTSQTGTTPSNQAAPAVTTTQTATDDIGGDIFGYSANGGEGHDHIMDFKAGIGGTADTIKFYDVLDNNGDSSYTLDDLLDPAKAQHVEFNKIDSSTIELTVHGSTTEATTVTLHAESAGDFSSINSMSDLTSHIQIQVDHNPHTI